MHNDVDCRSRAVAKDLANARESVHQFNEASVMPTCHAAPENAQPSEWIHRWLQTLAPGASVLDFAAGHGRHSHLALMLGLQVCAVDNDRSAVAAIAADAERLVVDLEHGQWPFEGRRFDAVVVSNYLFRPRLDLLAALVAPGGLLIYETFMRGNEQFGRPASPKFLLEAGELLQVAARAGLVVNAFEQGFETQPRPAMRQRLCAGRGALAMPTPASGQGGRSTPGLASAAAS